MLIFKIVHPGEWSGAQNEYAGSAKDRADGFLHFSTAEQLPATLARHYAKENDLLLVAVQSEMLGAALKFEPSSNGEFHPHLYAPLPIAAATWVRALKRGAKNQFVLPI